MWLIFVKESITSAIEDDNTDELDALLNDPHANLNVPNSMGLFPLHVAILRNNPVSRNDMVQQLLNKGADINVKAIPNEDHDEGGNTPLHMSAARDQLDTVRILLTYDPAISPTNNEGLTPYNYAEQNGNSEMMRLLKEEQRNAERSNKSSTCVILWPCHLRMSILLCRHLRENLLHFLCSFCVSFNTDAFCTCVKC